MAYVQHREDQLNHDGVPAYEVQAVNEIGSGGDVAHQQNPAEADPNSIQVISNCENGGDQSEGGNKSSNASPSVDRVHHLTQIPKLKSYFSFGPWIGRNRTAECNHCGHSASSSQPDRLLKHLNRCPTLPLSEKSTIEELIRERSELKQTPAPRGRGRPRTREPDYDLSAYLDDNSDANQSISTAPAATPAGPNSARRNRKTNIDHCLTKFIIAQRIPLKSIHTKEFLEFVKALDPDYRVPSREQITTVLIPALLNIL